MLLRLSTIATVFLIFSATNSPAQSVLFTNNAAYVDRTTATPTPRVTLNGYLNSFVQNGDTYQHVGVVLSNSFSTFNDIYNPAAGTPGTTFAYATNTAFGTLPTSKAWHVDMPLPVSSIATDPSNPTYITASLYLVDNGGNPYKNGPFATYCFMTYVAGGKVMTSPAGGPYIIVVPPSGLGMEEKQPKGSQVSAKSKPKALTLPAPSAQNGIPYGFWEIRPSFLPALDAIDRRSARFTPATETPSVVG